LPLSTCIAARWQVGIIDNLSAHKPKRGMWLARHKKVRFRYTPTNTSWLNQVEVWFSIPAWQSLHGASFKAVEDLKNHINAFIKTYNETAKPFVWTKSKVHQKRLKPCFADLWFRVVVASEKRRVPENPIDQWAFAALKATTKLWWFSPFEGRRSMSDSGIEAVCALLNSKPRPVGFAARRARLDEVAAHPAGDDISLEAESIDGLPLEWSLAKGGDPSRALLYFHGGGYCSGSIASHRGMVTAAGRTASPTFTLIHSCFVDHGLSRESACEACAID
jgi:DDE superfamily endonuclease